MDSLAANPTGKSSIYNSNPNSNDYSGALSIVNQLKDREMKDFKDKASFMSDLSLKQDRLKRLYDPEQQRANIQGNAQLNQQGSSPMGGTNVVQGQDPNQMTGYQKGELGIKQQELGQESQRINQQGKLGQEALNIKSDQEKLNQQKSDQINAEKGADLQRKTDEANKKLSLAQQALQDKTKSAEEQLQAHKDLKDAMEERFKLETARKQHEFDVTSGQHQQTIDDLTKKLDEAKHTKTTTEIDASGNKKTVTTDKGSSNTVQAKGKDGQIYEIPADKMDDKDSDGTPHWSPVQ